MDFAVTVNGKTQWVLAVEGDKLLMSPDDKKLVWIPMNQCKLAAVAGPEQPRPVIAIPMPKQGPKLSVPRLVRGNHG